MIEPPPIDTGLPIDIHPTSLAGLAKALDVEGSMGRHILADAHTALAVTYTTMSSIRQTRVEVEATHSTGKKVVSGGQVVHETAYPDGFFEAVGRADSRASRQIDSAHAGIQAKIHSLKDRVAKAMEHPDVQKPIAGEVRAHFKSLTSPQRLKVFREAVDAGDKRTVAAVLDSPHYLLGVGADEMKTFRAMAERKFAPLESSQLEAAKKALDKVEAAGNHLTWMVAEILELRNSPAQRSLKAIKQLQKGD